MPQTRQVPRPGAIKSGPQKGPSEVAVEPGQRWRRWRFSALAIALLCYTTLGWAVSLFQTERVAPTALSTASVVLTPLGTTIRNNADIALFAVVGLIVLTSLTRLNRVKFITLAAALLGCAILWSAMSIATESTSAGLSHLSIVMSAAIGVWSLGLRRSDLVVLGRVGFGIAVICLLMAATTSDAWTDQQADSKALIGDAVLAGFFPQMNPLGMSMAITLPFTLMFKRKWMRVLAFTSVALTLVMASSRTALFASGIAIVATLALRALPKDGRLIGGYVALAAVFITTVIVPLRSTNDAFTDRGAVWHASLQLIPQRPIWGFGPKVYGLGGEISTLVPGAFWHGHNMIITFLVVAGGISMFAILLFFLPALQTSLRFAQERHFVPFMAVITIAALGITEVPIRPSEFDGVAWVSWLTLFAVASISIKGDKDLEGVKTLPVSANDSTYSRLIAQRRR